MPLESKSKIIRAVVVDDSATARELIVSLLQNAGNINVVGVGTSGEDAIRLVKRLKPDVLTMDVRMKGMDGLEATRQIMRESPLPIILITSIYPDDDADLTFRALKAGALNVTQKPGIDQPETCENLVKLVRLMAGLPVVHHWGREGSRSRALVRQTASLQGTELAKIKAPDRLSAIGIGSSTGGPQTLSAILGPLPADFPWPVLLVQHVTNGFGEGMARWLSTQTALKVKLGQAGDIPEPGVLYFAPDNYHMKISARGKIELIVDAPYRGMRPSANFLFKSMAEYYGSRAIGILLTGMGDDGAEGLATLYQAGALTLAQDEASCVVYGMPRAAYEMGVVSGMLSPNKMAGLLVEFARQKSGQGS